MMTAAVIHLFEIDIAVLLNGVMVAPVDEPPPGVPSSRRINQFNIVRPPASRSRISSLRGSFTVSAGGDSADADDLDQRVLPLD